MTKVLVDGVVFQAGSESDRARWQAILSRLQNDARIALTVLDRGQLPELPTAASVPFPSLSESDRPADSRLIEAVCDRYAIDVFVTTGDTTPLATPMLLMIDDLTPDVLGAGGRERRLAISFAQRYLCTAEPMRRDLLALYPEISPAHASVARFGIDHDVFALRAAEAVDAFRRRERLAEPYVVFGDASVPRLAGDDEDLARLLSGIAATGIEIVSIGAVTSPPGVAVRSVGESVPEDRALAYNGAVAAIEWPADGGCPPTLVEALACGCPLITAATPAAAWACGAAALQIGRHIMGTLLEADVQAAIELVSPRGTARRDDLRRAGPAQASHFRWEILVDALVQAVLQLADEARRGTFEDFFAAWARLRTMQADVDFPP